MSIDHSQPESIRIPTLRAFKASHRTFAEQVVGFFIFLLASSGFQLLNHWFISFSYQGEWYHQLIQVPWALKDWPFTPFWSVYHFLLAMSMWVLWRRFSLRLLKLEVFVFFVQLTLQSIWSLSFFVFQETLLALFCLLLLLCNTLLSALLFWKKDRLSGQILIPSFLWIFYIMGINMAICISNP